MHRSVGPWLIRGRPGVDVSDNIRHRFSKLTGKYATGACDNYNINNQPDATIIVVLPAADKSPAGSIVGALYHKM